MRALAGLLLLLVTGCANIDSHTVSVTSGNAVQSGSIWRSDVLVTAAHIRERVSNTLCKDEQHDVMFVKNTNPASISPVWRDPEPGEPIRYVGRVYKTHTDASKEHVIYGQAMETVIVPWLDDEQVFNSGSGIVLQGMSGGTVFSEVDDASLGIITGVALTDGEPSFSIFVPSSTIKQIAERCGV